LQGGHDQFATNAKKLINKHAMNDSTQLVAFTLDTCKFALPLSQVERIVNVVEITPLPKAPEVVIGVVNVQGRIIPVVDIRKRFRLPEREMNLNDKLILSQTSKRSVGIMVDAVMGVIECPKQEVIISEKILSGIGYVEGVVKLEDGLTLIHNIDSFLSLGEGKTLDDAMKHP
jgi:purine-binding chemotaxis protein CheW